MTVPAQEDDAVILGDPDVLAGSSALQLAAKTLEHIVGAKELGRTVTLKNCRPPF